MKKHVIFHDPRLSKISGGGEVLTIRKMRALDPARFKLSIVTRSELRSPLLRKFLSDRSDVQFIPVDVPQLNEVELTRQMNRKGVSPNVLMEPIARDAICFNLAAEETYRALECDLLSVSVLPDLFCLDACFKTAFHIYGCPPAEQAPEQVPLLERVTSVSAISRHSAEEFKTLFPGVIQVTRMQILTPGLDKMFFQPVTTREKDIDFLFAGRLRPRKGVDLILGALSILGLAGIKLPRICLVGDGPERDNLETMAHSLGIEESVHFAGTVDSQEVIHWIDRSRWFLYPVRRPEAFGLAPLEAMARGVPSILGSLGGMSEYLVDGWNGYALPEVSAQVLADFMRKAMVDDEEGVEWQKHTVETAQRFSWGGFVERVNTFFGRATS